MDRCDCSGLLGTICHVYNSVDVIHFRPTKSAPLPIAELLARSSFPQSPQPSSAASSVQRAVTKRQVDPLHSCIEAKCSSWNSGNYLDCVYRQCVSGFQVQGKRSTDAEEPPADTFGHPEGRFLLLPVTFQSSNVEPQLFPPNLVQSSDEDEADEARRALVARARLARRRVSASRRARTALGSKQERSKRHVEEWDDGRSDDRDGQSDPLAAGLRASLLMRRSYNDIADVCVEHHCGQLPPHSISYFQCVEHHCTGKQV